MGQKQKTPQPRIILIWLLPDEWPVLRTVRIGNRFSLETLRGESQMGPHAEFELKSRLARPIGRLPFPKTGGRNDFLPLTSQYPP